MQFLLRASISIYYMIRIIFIVTVKLLLMDSALVIMKVNGSLLLTIMGRAPPLGNKLPVMLKVDEEDWATICDFLRLI